MTARELVLEQSPPVQIVLKVFVTADSLDNPGFDFDTLAFRAMEKWERIVDAVALPEFSQADLAIMLIGELRKREPWGRIISQDVEAAEIGVAR